jgi:hypothetical protein
MNIFYLHNDVRICAEMHNDKHVVKMILEYAQLLSTAHRFLDGIEFTGVSKSGRKQTRFVLSDKREYILYASTHINHPSAVWVRQTQKNYIWLSHMLNALCKEYTYRYSKIHKVERVGLLEELYKCPANIPIGEFTEPTPAMPDIFKVSANSVRSYINYYVGAKQHLASWKKRTTPEWYTLNA